MKFNNLRNIREDRDIRQREIAKFLNVSQNTYSQYETGSRQIPLEIIIALANLYKTSTDYLLGLTDNPKPYDRIL